MRKSEIKVGSTYEWGGYVVEVTEILPEGVVIECEEVGEDIVKPASLKEFSPAPWGYDPY